MEDVDISSDGKEGEVEGEVGGETKEIKGKSGGGSSEKSGANAADDQSTSAPESGWDTAGAAKTSATEESSSDSVVKADTDDVVVELKEDELCQPEVTGQVSDALEEAGR